MTTVLTEKRAIDILTRHCNPEIYPTEETMLRGLADMNDRDVLVSLRTFLGNVIDDDSMSAPQKARKYFNVPISHEEKADKFIDEIYCALSEYLFAGEE
jgi:hypothetical protein